MSTKFTPVRHSRLRDHHRVPIVNINGRYEIFVEENYVRIFDDETMPDLLKTRIAMAKAGTKKLAYEDGLGPFGMRIYECAEANKHLEDIGWAVTDNLWVLVLPSKYLTYLKTLEYPDDPRQIEGFGFVSSIGPTFSTLEGYLQWQHRKLRSKTKSKRS